jgi:hypothetical protein
MDPADDTDPGPPDPPPTTPIGLEYFAADAPERRESRAVMHGLGIVAVSLLPFACGVINVFVAAQSYSATVTGSHRGGAALFLLAGLLIGVIGMVRLLSLRNTPGIAIGLLVLGLEVAVVSCLGVAAIWG